MWEMGSYWFGQPQLFVYSFLVDGLLIDSGHPNVKNDFLQVLSAEEIEQCVITHHHEDHSGNAEAIRTTRDINVFASTLCVEIMRKPPKVSPIQYVTWGQNKPAKLIPLETSKTIDTSKYSFQVIDTPGHSADMISLYEPNEGWLFSADNYVNHYINIFMENENIDDQINSLERIRDLEFDVLLCSHNPQFKNGKEYVLHKLQFLRDFYGRIEQEYTKGATAKEIMKKLGLNEQNNAHIVSLGKLSRKNMVSSVMRSLESKFSTDL